MLVLSSRCWPNISPTYIAVWVGPMSVMLSQCWPVQHCSLGCLLWKITSADPGIYPNGCQILNEFINTSLCALVHPSLECALVHHYLFDSASLPNHISLFFTNKTTEKSMNCRYEAAKHKQLCMQQHDSQPRGQQVLTKLVHHCLFESASLPDLISLFFTNKTAEKSMNFHYEAAMHATRVCTLMSHDRFNTIWYYLHMQNEELQPHRDPVWKLHWLIMHLTTK